MLEYKLSSLKKNINNLIDEGGGFAFFPYGDSWRRLRRIAHGGLVKNKIELYQPILDERRTILLSHLFKLSQTQEKEGYDLSHLIEHYTMTSILAIAFGDMCSFQPGDSILHEAFKLTERAANTMGPADQIREFFPILKTLWPVKREKYLKVRDDTCEFYGGLLKQFKSKTEKQDCFVNEIINLNELSDLQIMNFVAIFVGAGSETTACTLEWLIAFLANHPHIQDKAYNEIIDAIGSDRLPEPHDGKYLKFFFFYIASILNHSCIYRIKLTLSSVHHHRNS